MEEKSIYNMVLSILSAICMIPILVLGIIFNRGAFSITMMSIYLPILLAYFILKSIEYGKEEDTDALHRVSNCILDIAITLISIHFIVLLKTPLKWVLLGAVIAFGMMAILLNAIEKGMELKYLLVATTLLILVFTVLYLYPFNIVVSFIIASILIGYCSHILGSISSPRFMGSFEILSMILFGLFLILI